MLVSGCNCSSWAQQILTQSGDPLLTPTVQEVPAEQVKNFATLELQNISKLLTELLYWRDAEDLLLDEVNHLKMALYSSENTVVNRDKVIANLKTEIEIIDPPWYDHFWVGAGVTGIILTALFVFAGR